MATGYSGGDDTLGDTGGDSAFDDCGHRVHRADDFGLELRWYMELDLLEEVFGGAEAPNDEDVLAEYISLMGVETMWRILLVVFYFVLEWR